VKLLLSYNASMNLRNEYGNTPLHWASLNGHKDGMYILDLDLAVSSDFGSASRHTDGTKRS